MELDILKLHTTWNDAAGSINTNFSKIKMAIASLQEGSGGLNEEELLSFLVNNGYITEEELSDYYTKYEVNELIDRITAGDIDLANYYTKEQIDDMGFLTSASLVGYATQGYVSEQISKIDLSPYATKLSLAVEAQRIDTLESYFSTSADADAQINKWNEIVSFLNATEGTTLAGILAAYTLKSDLRALAYRDGLSYSEVGVTKEVVTSLIGPATYAPYNASGYLPLTGGKIEGALTISVGSDVKLILNSTDGEYYNKISVREDGEEYGELLFANNITSIRGLGNLVYNSNIVLTTNNIGSYKAGDSALLAGMSPTSYLRLVETVLTSNVDANELHGMTFHVNTTGNGSGNTNIPVSYGYLLNLCNSVASDATYYKGVQLSFGSGDVLQFRRHWGYAWQPWKTIAFTDSDITGSARSLKAADGNTFALIDSSGHVVIGNKKAQAGYNTHIDGNFVTLRYGRSNTIGLLLNNNGNITIGGGNLAGTTHRLYVSGTAYVANVAHLTNVEMRALNASNYIASLYMDSNGFHIQGRNEGVAYINTILNQSGGNVLIGTTTDNRSGAKLQVNGGISIASGYTLKIGDATISYVNGVLKVDKPFMAKGYAAGATASVSSGEGGVVLNKDSVIEALGYTPYDSANPNGYITTSALSGYQLSSGLGSLAYKSSLVASDIPDLSGKYLPLMGGVITAETAYSFTIQSKGTGSTFMSFRNNNRQLGYLGVGYDGAPKFAGSDGVGKTIWYAGNFNPSDYLPKTGGTIGGAINVNGRIILDDGQALQFKNDSAYSTQRLLLPYSGDNYNLNYYDGTGWRRILHSGNVGEYKAGDSDKLGGSSASYYMTSVSSTSQDINQLPYTINRPYILRVGATNPNLPNAMAYGNLVHFACAGTDTAFQLMSSYSKDLLLYRRGEIATIFSNPWKTIAFTDSTVASAYRLLTKDNKYMVYLSDVGNLIVGNNIATGETHIIGNRVILSYGTSATTYGLILNSSGNVTIGAQDYASSNYNFAVLGKSTFRHAILADRYNGQGNTAGASFIINKGGDYFGMGASTSLLTYLSFGSVSDNSGTWKTEFMTFANNGDVGIGTTSPAYKLDVNGHARANAIVSNGVIDINRNPNDGAILNSNLMGLEVEAYASRVQFKAYTTSGTSLTGITINSNDYVGIGTTDPEYKLEVKGKLGVTNTNAAIEIVNGGVAGNVAMSMSVSTYARIQATHHKTDYNVPLAINPDGGNVLIGKTTDDSSGAKLQVDGKVSIGTDLILNGRTAIYTNSTSSHLVFGSTGVTSYWRGGEHVFQSGASNATAMTILATGAVTMASTLSVAGALTAAGATINGTLNVSSGNVIKIGDATISYENGVLKIDKPFMAKGYAAGATATAN